ncbi:MAG TPA: aminotransferase class I/II-fold pyridoxal phosphate-dependent enzyme [Candidatus Nanoarchaeia archaeon]|nr:dTDP-3-amino-3,4,6-trideoxy-alpha-D-glucose transaminase [uncultured archaeon]
MASSTPKLLLKHLVSPNTLQKGPYPEKLTEKLATLFKTKVFVVNSGRSAIFLALKALGVGQSDEVLVQAYTCNAVPNPVLWVGATPVYVDIEEKILNMDPKDLEAKITLRTKAIIVQHTFGNPAKIKEILKIADNHKLKVIEDCAHSLGAKVDGRLLGTFGDLAILSFGREKVISSLTGGALLVNNEALVEAVEDEIKFLKPLPLGNILREINNYFSWRLLFRKLLSKEWGSSLVRYLYQFDLVNVVTSQKELSGQNPGWYPTLLPNVFAHVACEELDNVDSYNVRRGEVAHIYREKVKENSLKLLPAHEGIYLRVVAFHPQAKRIFEEGRAQKIPFGNWYNSVIYPESVHLSKFGYQSGSCPVAEKLAAQTINLPNFPRITEAETDRVVEFLQKFS